MDGWRVKLIDMIDEIDGVSANDTVIIMDLIKWLPAHLIERFINDTIETHRLYDDYFTSLEDCVGGPEAEEDNDDAPSCANEALWAETEDTESYDEDYFFNEGVKAAEALKAERIERHLQLMQCSEV